MSENRNFDTSKPLDLHELVEVSAGTLSDARKDFIAIHTKNVISNGWPLEKYLNGIEPYTSAEDREYVKENWDIWKKEYEEYCSSNS